MSSRHPNDRAIYANPALPPGVRETDLEPRVRDFSKMPVSPEEQRQMQAMVDAAETDND